MKESKDSFFEDSDPSIGNNLIAVCINADGISCTERRKYVWGQINFLKSYDYLKLKDVEKRNFSENKHARIVYMDCERYKKFLMPESNESKQNDNFEYENNTKSYSFVETLNDMIMRVLCDNKKLVYFQGFHDIATVLLLVMGPNDGTALLRVLTKKQLKDFMSPDFRKTTEYLDLVIKLIEINDHVLYQFIKRSNVGSVFCLSWILTWYAHSVKSFSLVCRLFDFFMVTDKYMSVYVAATLVMGLRDEILALECDMASVHSFLSRIPENITLESWEKSIETSLQLFDQFPPESIFLNGFGYFSYRTVILVSGWSRTRKNKTLLRHSILNGTAKCINKSSKRRFKTKFHKSSSSSKDYWILDNSKTLFGLTFLVVAFGIYTIYPYVNSLYK